MSHTSGMLRRMAGDETDTPPLVALGNRLLHIVEDVVYGAVAVLLSAASVVVVVKAGIGLVTTAGEPGTAGILDVLDSLLLVFILVELLFAVRITLEKREVIVEPFLLVGILAAIKEIVVLSVKAAEEYITEGPEFARAMVEIGILGALIVVLAVAAVLMRRKEAEPEEGS